MDETFNLLFGFMKFKDDIYYKLYNVMNNKIFKLNNNQRIDNIDNLLNLIEESENETKIKADVKDLIKDLYVLSDEFEKNILIPKVNSYIEKNKAELDELKTSNETFYYS